MRDDLERSTSKPSERTPRGARLLTGSGVISTGSRCLWRWGPWRPWAGGTVHGQAGTVVRVPGLQRSVAASGEAAGRGAVHAVDLPGSEPATGVGRPGSLDRLIEDAACRIARLDPVEAFSAAAQGGIIIDIRSQDVRESQGVIPGSLHIPRTVLEWRIAVDSPWRNRHLGGLDEQLILICDHGYSSILAASNLIDLGFYRAADVIGGFGAWREHDLPIAPCRHRLSTVGGLPGTGPPE
jgi:rhodanese-related sulfurtransferase